MSECTCNGSIPHGSGRLCAGCTASLRADLAEARAEIARWREVNAQGLRERDDLRAKLDAALMSLHAAAGEQTTAAAEEYLTGEAKCWQCGERVEAQGGRWSCRCGREWTADGVIRDGGWDMWAIVAGARLVYITEFRDYADQVAAPCEGTTVIPVRILRR